MEMFIIAVWTFVVLTLVFGALIFVHEFGHFIAAKRAGVLVEQFAFGFGPKIVGKKFRETEYRINLLPLGGYIKMVGDNDGASLSRKHSKDFTKKEIKEVQAIFDSADIDLNTARFEVVDEFVNSNKLDKKAAKLLINYFNYYYIPNHAGNYDNIRIRSKFFIMIGGVTMNIVLAIILFYGLLITNDFKAYFPFLVDPITVGGKVQKTFPYLSYLEDSSKGEYENSLILELQVKLFSLNDYKVHDTKLTLSGAGVASNLDDDITDGVFIAKVTKDSVAEKSGLNQGDFLLEINGEQIDSIEHFISLKKQHAGEDITLTVMTASNLGDAVIRKVKLSVPASEDEMIGIKMSGGVHYVDEMLFYYDYSENKFLSGIYHTINIGIFNIQGLSSKVVESFKTKSFEPISESVGGIVAVTDVTYSLVKVNDFRSIIDMTAMLNVILAIMNILPIPLLDGGHVVFLAIEKFRGKPISEKKQEKISVIAFWGFIILTILIFAKDIIVFEWPSRIYNLIRRLFM